jgi:hypothetical protein
MFETAETRHSGLKMAMDIHYPDTHGYPTRWVRMWILVFTRGCGYGFDFISMGKMKTGMKNHIHTRYLKPEVHFNI